MKPDNRPLHTDFNAYGKAIAEFTKIFADLDASDAETRVKTKRTDEYASSNTYRAARKAETLEYFEANPHKYNAEQILAERRN